MTSAREEEEREAFERIARELSTDAQFFKSVSTINQSDKGIRNNVLCAVGVVVGVAVILGSVTFFDGVLQILGGVLGFVVMLAAGMTYKERETQVSNPIQKSPAPAGSFMSKLEQDWEDRRRRDGIG